MMSHSYHPSDKVVIDELNNLRQKVADLENKLDNNQDKYNNLENAAQAAQICLWNWNLSTNKFFLSNQCKIILGYSEKEIEKLQYNWEKIIHPNDFSRIHRLITKIAEDDSVEEEASLRILHHKGHYLWVHIKASLEKDKSGKVQQVCGSLQDVNQEKSNEQLIADNERRYKRLFENSLVGILTVDLKTGKIIEANNRGWNIVKATPQDHINIFNSFFNPEQKKQFIKKISEQGYIENEEISIGREEESWYSINASFYPEDGVVDFTILEITEHKRNIIELQKLNVELDNFVYHSSHDLRSPLKSILGLVNILRKEKDPKGQETCLDMVEESIQRLDKLVNDLLMISRNNRIDDSLEPVNLMLEINQSVSSFYHADEAKNLQILTEIYQPIQFVTDATRLRIVFNNLISNAIKYRNYNHELSFVKIYAKVTEHEAVIEISDNGVGIPASKQEKVFEMFYRASESSEGSGLGLYIVKNVVEKMKGKITMKSEERKGTTFSLTFPNQVDA